MNREQAWKTFNLGTEINISGTFIYNGLRCFHEMQTIDCTEEIFDFLYNLSVGIERLLKVAIILLEYTHIKDQKEFEKSLMTHNHLDLIKRVQVYHKLRLDKPHYKFLHLLSNFYHNFRYARFNLSGAWDPDQEKTELRNYLENNLQMPLELSSSTFPAQNTAAFRNHIGKITRKISQQIFAIVKQAAEALNLYTHELSSTSKAAKIFLKGEGNFDSESILWKELLIFFMNTKATTELLNYLRSIEPLEFDEALASDYLQCFQSQEGERFVIDELESHYASLNNPGKRLEQMRLIGDPMIDFDPLEDIDE